MRRILFTLTIVGLATTSGDAHAQQAPVVVHEWGTITTHHAPDGTPLGRLNHVSGTDTLPSFVHRFEPLSTSRDPNLSLVKTALVAGRPDVTMRLETPVIYFYPPRGTAIRPFDVSVRFRGGILNEFFPKGAASVSGQWNGESLSNDVVGALTWHDVTLEDSVPLTPTRSHVWLAPRRVAAAGVASAGESERYLFYRGVAHLGAPLQTRLTGSEVLLFAPRDLAWMSSPVMTIPRAWVVDVRPNGEAAFRVAGALCITKNAPSRELARLSLFAKQDYALTTLGELRRSMKQALTGAGLFDAEAEAMLETWKGSYFDTPGLRVFYLVPNEWAGYFLPLSIGVPNRLTRVLVGRIDIVRDRN